jgi:integrase
VNGIVSVNKARVAEIDRDQTKTGEDRRIALCRRAWAVLMRQLALRARLKAAGLIRHNHAFFRETGEPFWKLQIQAMRWRATLSSLKLLYRRPYVARHSSVSWNLVIGKTRCGSRSSTATASPPCCASMPRGRGAWSNPTSRPSDAR